MLEQQEGGPVQAHRRLARAGPTLHHQQLGQRGPDDLVLLGGDGGHDVAHLAGAGPFQLGQQRIGQAAGAGAVGIVEGLVEQGRDLPVLHHEPAAVDEPARVDGRGPVEGGRHRGPPVDHDRPGPLVLHVAAPDVPALGVLGVDPAEGQRAAHVAQGRLPPLEVVAGDAGVDGVLLAHGPVADGPHLGRPGCHRRQMAVGARQPPLLGGQIAVGFPGRLCDRL